MAVPSRSSCARLSFAEVLEGRQLLSAAPVHPHHQPSAHPQHHHAVHVKPDLIRARHHSNTYNGYGHTPQDIRTVYGFGALGDQTQGAGQTIAIVDAYDDPNIAKDLATFDKQFGVVGTNTLARGNAGSVYNFFSKVSQTGSATSLPTSNGSWAQEISLDVEWAHSIAPGANILLVEAKSNSTADLLTAVDYARTQASVVSMSWGSSEYSTESANDFHFQSPSSTDPITGQTTITHPVTFVASAGDTGGQREWPAESPNVVSVGGTTVYFHSDATYNYETGWVNSGGGTSAYESKPGYQGSLSYANRSGPDVGYDADPNSGFAVYDSLRYTGQSGWMVFGGTSAGAPQWSALIAVADAGRSTPLDGVSQTLPALYTKVPSSHFHDVNPTPATTTAGGTSTGPGYDQITGLGTPFNGTDLILDLINA